MRDSETRLRVRYAETDQMGVAYYGNYFTWFEVARVDWCSANGFRYRDMEREDGCMLVVADARCRYKAPTRFDDEVVIHTRVTRAHSRMVTFEYEVRNAETAEVVATGETRHLIVGHDMKMRPLPRKYFATFSLDLEARPSQSRGVAAKP